MTCGRCGAMACETCWYCHAGLCGECWETVGHCGHPEAEETNELGRNAKPGDVLEQVLE